MFSTLQDRLTATFKNLRGKGKLSDADIDATLREIRVALLEADVALPVVKEFIDAVRERAKGAEVLQALNPAQQVLSDQMVAYWSQFVKTGAPDVEGQPDWPQLGADAATGPRMSLQTGPLSITTDYAARHQCAFWATVKGAG